MDTLSEQTGATAADPSEVAEELRRVVDHAERWLGSLDPGTIATGSTGAWSMHQILGHLVDSAANNHARFVRAQLEEELVFHGYAQDAWVDVQGYDDEPWADLVALWASFNRHIAHVIARIEPLEWSRPRARHNLDAIGFAPIEASRLGTLAWLVVDYVAHLKHHLDALDSAVSRSTAVG